MTSPSSSRNTSDPAVTGLKLAKILVWVVYAYFALAVILLVMAFFLQLFNASTTAAFTEWVYRSAGRVLQPFRGIFPTAEIGENGSVVDYAIVFAIIMYGIFALVIHSFVDWLDRKAIERQAAIDREQAEEFRAASMQAQQVAAAQAQQAATLQAQPTQPQQVASPPGAVTDSTNTPST